MMKKVVIQIDGVEVIIEFSSHAIERLKERGVDTFQAVSLIMKVGEEILDFKTGEQFGVIDQETDIGLVAAVNADDNIYIDVITVLRNDKIYFSKGLKILKAKDIFEMI